VNSILDAIIPKSDQLNADDLIGRSLTIVVSEVVLTGGEQPVTIRFDGDNGKPYKPCKSMCRVLVNAWGADCKLYAGRSMTLFRDPKVKWGGLEVGGIRISHLSHIEGGMVMALTETGKNKRPFRVLPMAATAAPVAQPRRTVRDILAAIQARITAGDDLAEIEASPDVVLIRTKGSDAAKAELGQILSAAHGADAGNDGEYGQAT
jgi:hypothetical protein